MPELRPPRAHRTGARHRPAAARTLTDLDGQPELYIDTAHPAMSLEAWRTELLDPWAA